MSVLRHLAFSEDRVRVFYNREWRTMSLDEAAELDKPAGVATVHVSAVFFRDLIRYREAALILASPDDDDS